jgi:hypothetical protein
MKPINSQIAKKLIIQYHETMREIKKSVNGYSVGFWINKKFVILKNLKPLLVKIEKEYCPF